VKRDFDQEDLDALLAALPHHMSHLPARLAFDDLSVLIDAWKSVREVPPSDPNRPAYYGSLVSDMVLIEELSGRLSKFRWERLWWLSLPQTELPSDVDREVVLDIIEKLARLLVDDAAQHAIVRVVKMSRLREKGGDQ
jgi:hypothetical protein